MKKVLIAVLCLVIGFLIYDKLANNTVKSHKAGPVKHEVAKKTGTEIRKPIITKNNSVKTYIDGKEAFPVLENLIKSAQKTLFIEIFIFHYDPTGLKIANLIADKKKQGVDVKVIVDSTGLKFAKEDSKIVDLLKGKGVDIRVFNETYLSNTGVNISHRKIILADGERVMIGGMNFGKEYEKEWHDSLTEIDGEAAQEIQKEFLYEWHRVGGAKPKNVIIDLPKKQYGNTPVNIVVTNVTPDNTNHELHYAMIAAVDNAKKNLKVQSPYFSDNELISAIVKAKKRGVNVDVIMPKHNNHSVFKDLNLSTAKTFSDNGINVYFYKPVFSHLKLITNDDTAIVGSANIDERSFSGNQEICAVIQGKDIVQDLNKRVFERDIPKSEKVKKGSLKIGVIQQTSIKALEAVDYYF